VIVQSSNPAASPHTLGAGFVRGHPIFTSMILPHNIVYHPTNHPKENWYVSVAIVRACLRVWLGSRVCMRVYASACTWDSLSAHTVGPQVWYVRGALRPLVQGQGSSAALSTQHSRDRADSHVVP
jgi:hypothetical protein